MHRMTRKLSNTEISTFRDDGVALLKSAVEQTWVNKLLGLVDSQMANPSRWVNDSNPGANRNRLFTDRYLWQENQTINDYLRNSGVAGLAAQAMSSKQIRFYFDHLLIKEPATQATTPWHQDVPYWPFMGQQICSIWLALTSATVSGSAMEFVRGSHLDNKYYAPKQFGDRADHPSAWQLQGEGEEVPDIDGNRADFDIVGFDVEPGDAIIFSAWILHGAPGNGSSEHRRAALSTRWLGDDVVWYPHSGADPTVSEDDVSVETGQYPADDERFPLIWNEPAA